MNLSDIALGLAIASVITSIVSIVNIGGKPRLGRIRRRKGI